MIKLGVITNSRDVDGTFFVMSDINGITSLKENSLILIGFSEQFSEKFTYQKIRKTKNGYYLNVKEISTPENVVKFKEKAVFVNNSDLIFDDKVKINDWTGFKVLDTENDEYIGDLIEEIELPTQNLFVIKQEEKEILIPNVSEFVVKIDKSEKKVYIKLIEGLIE